jgi:hypothetical protein
MLQPLGIRSRQVDHNAPEPFQNFGGLGREFCQPVPEPGKPALRIGAETLMDGNPRVQVVRVAVLVGFQIGLVGEFWHGRDKLTSNK